MWIGLIISFVLFGGLAIGAYVEGTTDLDLDYSIPEFRFRRDIKNEPNPYTYYNTEMDEATRAEYDAYNKKLRIKNRIKQTLVHCIPAVVAIALIFGVSVFSSFLENESLAQDIASYEAYSITMEMSLENEELTGLERLELVKQASEKNAWLLSKQYTCHCWYSFHLRDDLVNKIDNLEIIDIS